MEVVIKSTKRGISIKRSVLGPFDFGERELPETLPEVVKVAAKFTLLGDGSVPQQATFDLKGKYQECKNFQIN